MSNRMFPLQAAGRDEKPGPRQIPWSIAEQAYGSYSAQYGDRQSLERLAQRGGFSPGEMDMFYPQWRQEVSEITQLARRVADLEKQLAAREAQLLNLAKVDHPCAACALGANPPAALRAYVEGLLPEKAKHLGNFDESWGFCDADDKCNCDATEAHNACIEQVRENLNKSLEGK